MLAGVVPFLACTKLKAALKYDDALDTFGVHGVGGTLGALLTGIFATPDVNANLNTNLADIVGSTLWIEQLKAIGVTLAISVVGTVVLAIDRQGRARPASRRRGRGVGPRLHRPRRVRLPPGRAGRPPRGEHLADGGRACGRHGPVPHLS